MVTNFLKILLAFLILGQVSELISQSQTRRDIRKREQELQSLRNEIKILDQKIQESARREKKELSILDDYDYQLRLLKKLLTELEEEERLLN
jgi:cell division protein FtsB